MIQYKKIFALLFVAGLLVFSGCEPNEEIYKDYDKAEIGNKKNIEHTLTSNDYSTISNIAFDKNPNDSVNTAFISANEFFTDSISAADYVPFFMNINYPSSAPGSKADITFNYHGDMPEELGYYAHPVPYELSDEDYALVNAEVGDAKYFFPDYPAALYLPTILDSTFYDEEEDDLVVVTYDESNSNPPPTVLYEGFSSQAEGLGQFNNFSVTGPQNWQWEEFDNGCVTMSGYDDGQVENENWLISEPIDLSGESDVTLHFRHAVKYIGEAEPSDMLDVMISTDFREDDTLNTQWQSLQYLGFTWPEGNDWNFINSGEIDISIHSGDVARLCFKYTSNDSIASTWEIGEVSIGDPGHTSVSVGDLSTKKRLYYYNGSEWEQDENAYYLNPSDYDQMGIPGEHDNFSEDEKPADYIPLLLNHKYPLAGKGVSKIIVYDYYNGEGSVTLASEYTKQDDGTWTSAYDYIQPVTQQFVVAESRGNWVFNPDVTFIMASSDYQIIVDAVKEKHGSKYIDSYGTGEFYSGANSYYSNFDIRISKRVEYEPEIFEGLSDAEAMEIIHWRLAEAMQLLLQNKYPEAIPEVSGITVNYKVTFETFNNDYSRSTWLANMRCVAAAEGGTPPQFELVDNTFLRDGEPVPVSPVE